MKSSAFSFLRKTRRGAAAVEAAIILMSVMLMTLGVLQFIMALSVGIVLESSVQAAARIGQMGGTPAQALAAAQNAMLWYATSCVNLHVTVYQDITGLGSPGLWVSNSINDTYANTPLTGLVGYSATCQWGLGGMLQTILPNGLYFGASAVVATQAS